MPAHHHHGNLEPGSAAPRPPPQLFPLPPRPSPSAQAPPLPRGSAHLRCAGRRRFRAPAPPAPAAARSPPRTPPCRPRRFRLLSGLFRLFSPMAARDSDHVIGSARKKPLWAELSGGDAPSSGRSLSSQWSWVLQGCLESQKSPKSASKPPGIHSKSLPAPSQGFIHHKNPHGVLDLPQTRLLRREGNNRGDMGGLLRYFIAFHSRPRPSLSFLMVFLLRPSLHWL